MKLLKDRNEEKRVRLRDKKKKKKTRGGSPIESNEKKRAAVRLILTFPAPPSFSFLLSDHIKPIILNDLSLFMHSTRYEKEDADRYNELISMDKALGY